jgi:hypothetical protein
MRVRSQITMQAANIGMENPGQATLGDVADATARLYNEQKARNDAEYQRWQTRNAREDEKWKVEQKGLALEGAAYDFQLTINKKLENNEVLSTEDVHMASYYGIPLPGVPGVYAEATPGSVLKTAREGDSKWLRFESPASGSGSGGHLTADDKKTYAGNVYEVIYEAGYMAFPDVLGPEDVRKELAKFYADEKVDKGVKDVVRNTIDAIGGIEVWRQTTNAFASKEQSAAKTRRMSDDAFIRDLLKDAGGQKISPEAFTILVTKRSTATDADGKLLYPSLSGANELYKKSPFKEDRNRLYADYKEAATALELGTDATDPTPGDPAAVIGQLRKTHSEVHSSGWTQIDQEKVVNAAIDDAKISIAETKNKIVTKFTGILKRSGFVTFREMVEKHGVQYYNSTHGIFDDSTETDEYKVFRNIMEKLKTNTDSDFVNLYYASIMSITLGKISDSIRIEEAANNITPAQNVQEKATTGTSEDD